MRPRIPDDAQHSVGAQMYLVIEAQLRAAGRGLECAGVTDAEAARLAPIIFRLAQRVAVDAGRLAAR